MDLVLWRHAEAVEAEEGGNDLDRALTPRGKRHAQDMAAWLDRHLSPEARVLVSPARRTQQTAKALDRKFETVPELGPDGTVDALLAAAGWPDAADAVLVVGHQPVLGMAAATLLAGDEVPWTMRKAGVWWLRSREREGRLQTVLHCVISPDVL